MARNHLPCEPVSSSVQTLEQWGQGWLSMEGCVGSPAQPHPWQGQVYGILWMYTCWKVFLYLHNSSHTRAAL